MPTSHAEGPHGCPVLRPPARPPALCGVLRWLDLPAGDALPDAAVARRHIDTVVAAVRPRRQGGTVNGAEHGFALLCGRRPFAVAPDGPGRPDGLTVDAEGGVRAALYDGGAVHRYALDGTLDAVFVREFAG